MKQNLRQGSLILLVMSCSFGCKKSVDQSLSTPVGNNNLDTTLALTNSVIPFPVTPTIECNSAPSYGDSIVFSQPASTTDSYVYPQNNLGISGNYLSWPAGLIIDAKTGAINLTQSETGERYAIGFVKSGTTDTCMSQLIIGGAAYMDSIYVLSQSDTTSRPYFNANPNTPSPCQGKGCSFDYNHFAKNQGIRIDKKTGFIDLQKTMKNGPFGPNPVNGAKVNTTIYYQLNDESNNASQQIQLQMIYYNHKSDIPPALLTNVTNRLANTMNSVLISQGPSIRPPLIVIVRAN